MSKPKAHPLARFHRSGYLMLDMMITMALITMLLSISSVWIHKTFLYCADVNDRDVHRKSISKVSHDLRSKASLASTISVQGDSLSLVRDGDVTEYKIDKNTISRTDNERARTRFERFTFAKNANLKWIAGESQDQVTLEIRRDFSNLHVNKEESSRLDAQIRIRANRSRRPQ